MEQEEAFETKEKIMVNRIRIRKYLRELLLNSKKIDKIIEMNTMQTLEEAAELAQKDYVSKKEKKEKKPESSEPSLIDTST
jgi:hypothetical protein